MTTNVTTPHFLDLLPVEVTVSVKAIEFIVLPFSIAFVVGMYKGVEINHPVYAVLFCNAAFSTATSLFDASASFFILSFKTWTIVSIFISLMSQLFHVVSWSGVSVLRYLYIIKKDWLHQKFLDPSKLKVVSLISVWAFYILLKFLFFLNVVILFYLPYGLSEHKTFILLPRYVQLWSSLVSLLLFFSPILVSLVCYLFLLKALRKLNNDDAKTLKANQNCNDFERHHPISSPIDVETRD